jgi:glycogen(starch) synthase
MRVLFWTGTFWPSIGGVEVLATKLLPALRDRGYEYIVVAPKSHPRLADQEFYKGIPVYRFHFFNNLNHGSIDHVVGMRQQVSRLKRAFAPSLIHINSVGLGNFFHLATANVHPCPLLVTLHGEWDNAANTIVGHTLRAADWVAGCSSAIVEKARQAAPEIAPRSSVIYNALEAPALLPAPLPVRDFRLLCVGRLVTDKGFDLALQALSLVIERLPNTRLVIAGDGPERSNLMQQVSAFGLKDAVDFVGWIAPDAVASLMNSATAVLMPSRYETFGLVALEAAFMARPVVATRVGGLAEVVVAGETGLLVEKDDSKGLADAIYSLLKNPEMAVRMGQAARSRAQTVFSWERHVDAYDALYRQLITEGKAAVTSPSSY